VAAVPFALLCMTLFFTFFEEARDGTNTVNTLLIIGVARAVAVGEIAAAHSVKKHRAALAAQRDFRKTGS